MQKGDEIIIWEDPITKTKPEGMARLIKLTYRDPDELFERWIVHFLSDESLDDRYERVIYA